MVERGEEGNGPAILHSFTSHGLRRGTRKYFLSFVILWAFLCRNIVMRNQILTHLWFLAPHSVNLLVIFLTSLIGEWPKEYNWIAIIFHCSRVFHLNFVFSMQNESFDNLRFILNLRFFFVKRTGDAVSRHNIKSVQ